MNRLVLTALALSSVFAAAGCNNNTAPPVYVIADWQVRCDTVMGMCTPPMRRAVTGENAEMSNIVSCSVAETADARTISFRAGSSTGGYEAQMTGARVVRAGGFAGGSGCRFTFSEGANRFTGPCGGAAPSTEQPCRVEVQFGFDMMVGSTTTTVSVLCDHVPNEATTEQLRSFTSPVATDQPDDFVFYDCVGLSRE